MAAPQRNMVQRIDGKLVNAGRKRGMLAVCATGCCCGLTDRGYAPVWHELYHTEWERRKLRNRVHLNMGGCLGPCPLANVAMLLFDGRPIWFHSLNDEALIPAIYDYIDAMLAADRYLPPPAVLAPHVFNGFAWEGMIDGAQGERTGTRESVSRLPAAQAPTHRMTSGHTVSSFDMAGDGIVFLTQADTDVLVLHQARAFLPDGFAPVTAINIGARDGDEEVDAALDTVLHGAGLVVVRLLSGAGSFKHGLERLRRWAVETAGFVLCLPGTDTLDPELMALSNVGVPLAHTINAYLQCGGAENAAQGLRFLSDHLLLTGWGYDAPRELPRHGVYVPAATHCAGCSESACANTPLLLADAASGACAANRPVVGVLFYRAHLLSGNTAFVDAIIDEIEAQGIRARAVYTYALKDGEEGEMPPALRLFCKDGVPEVDAVICTLSFALGGVNPDGPTLSGWEVEALQQLDVPVIQAIASSSSRQQWIRSGRGLSPLDTAMNVAIPEFDGRIIGVPISFKEQLPGANAIQYAPDVERIRRVVGLARRLSTLRTKPNADKRIAFVLTNSSAKAARIGNAVGLDAPASLMRLFAAMQAAGYRIEGLPPTSDRLIADLIDRCSYDQTWLTDGQLAQATRLPIEQYAGWFAELPPARQAQITKQWGTPPGEAYVHDDALALAGLPFGNVFVALQPPRGYGMDPNAIYHQPDLPPPHNYYALYRWLRDEWGADAIVHVGKHGTLEWLPGKGVGLSDECFPDLFLDDLPLVYPFIINDPGEGNQAKRRAHAVIVDHMTPPMTSAGAYGKLAELAQLVDEYYQVEQLDPAKLPLLQRQIWQVLEESKLADDLQYILKADPTDPTHAWDGELLDDGTPMSLVELEGRQVAHLLEEIEGYLCELTGAQIRDGLHILGQMPRDEQLIELLYHLTKLPNLDVPGLPRSVAVCYDAEWDVLQADPGARLPAPRTLRTSASLLHTHADVIAFVENESKRLLRTVAAHDWNPAHIPAALAATLGEEDAPPWRDLTATLEFICEQLIPNLRHSEHDEIAHLLHALDGGYIPAGPSGAPTRGMAHVLPTGRNFYACDPRALPSVAAWRVGQELADDLLRRYLQEEGTYPESVGLSIWGTSAMRTYGDDIAQVLHLLGVRPRWQRENRRVLGVEVIPLEELGRPRVDVVCRISGFFRDAFPHLIHLLDAAVQEVIARDEPLEQNFPRKHALLEQQRLLDTGTEPSLAEEQARYRVFGCKPGSYGAGILPLIDAQNWTSDADFARAYVAWGGYAYTAAEGGVAAQEQFQQALSGVQVATKNQDNREHDIFDSDDYLQYHGGMIATIRALSGKNPRRYFGDSSDPQRPRTRDLREEARRVFRSRVVNPKWLESMRRHGYKGALEMTATVDYLFGYDATAQVLDDWMYHTIAETYLRDEEMQQFFSDSNPWAWQAISERLLEAVEREMWQDPAQDDLLLLEAARSLGLQELLQRQER